MRVRVTPRRGEYVKQGEIYCKATGMPSLGRHQPKGGQPRAEGFVDPFVTRGYTITEGRMHRMRPSIIDDSTAHGSDIVRR